MNYQVKAGYYIYAAPFQLLKLLIRLCLSVLKSSLLIYWQKTICMFPIAETDIPSYLANKMYFMLIQSPRIHEEYIFVAARSGKNKPNDQLEHTSVNNH